MPKGEIYTCDRCGKSKTYYDRLYDGPWMADGWRFRDNYILCAGCANAIDTLVKRFIEASR